MKKFVCTVCDCVHSSKPYGTKISIRKDGIGVIEI